ncbi:MAG: ATP synthase F1 subunit delta [Fusobacteriia bacterium 4572_132]|nr:MAG: ATP synthase F1 subunit delta [Fusobacteriia bacterium 4572_132]
MIKDVIGQRYAKALYEIAEEKENVMELYKDLKAVLDVYTENEEFSNFINHPELTKNDRKKMLFRTFKENVNEESLMFLNYLIDKERLIYLDSISKEYLKIYYTKNNIIEVDATFSIEPNEGQKSRLKEKLKKMTSKEINLNVEIDKTILGGGILKIGDKIIDGSLKRQFEMLRTNL